MGGNSPLFFCKGVENSEGKGGLAEFGAKASPAEKSGAVVPAGGL